MKDGGRKTIKHPMSIYRCNVHDLIRKLRSFPASRTKRIVNAFLYIVTSSHPMPPQ